MKMKGQHWLNLYGRRNNVLIQNLKLLCLKVISDLDAMKAVLSNLLVPKAVKELLQQYEAANNYLFFEVSEEIFYVKTIHWESFDPQDPMIRYSRTRIVEATFVQSGGSTATCSCRQFKRKGCPCRHLYCILGGGPLVTDCYVKQLKWFEAYHTLEKNSSPAVNPKL
jgi:hypothetical protein